MCLRFSYRSIIRSMDHHSLFLLPQRLSFLDLHLVQQVDHLKWTPEGKIPHDQTPSSWPKSSLKVGRSSNALVTPLHLLPPTSSSQLTPAPTPRKKVRWSESAHASLKTNQSATRPASARSLSKQLNSCGSSYTDDSQRRFNVMNKAKENLHADNTAYSQEEIKKRANQYEKNLK